jgi:transposase
MRAAGCAMTPEQAQAIYVAGEQAVVKHLCALDAQVQAGEQKIEALERELARRSKNSSTSSKPPSSDDITKPNKRAGQAAEAQGKANTIGAQPGHRRHTRAPYPPETLGEVHEYASATCPHCAGTDLLRLEDVPPRVIQQTEIKEVVVVREEHRAYAYWCEGCGAIHYAELPESVHKEGLFKARLTALVAYMKHVCHASFSTNSQIPARRRRRDGLARLLGQAHRQGQRVVGATVRRTPRMHPVGSDPERR